MFVEEIQLFKGFGPDFMEEITDAAQEVDFAEDLLLFNRGDPAENLYVLVEGSVNLFIKDGGSINFIVDEPGEIFGWSALVEPNIYTASAMCFAGAKALKIEGTRLEHILERHPKEAYRMMKRLAGVVGQRLTNSYEDILRSRSEAATPSYG